MGQLQGQLQAEVKRLQGQVQQARSEEEEAQEQRHVLKLQLTKVSTLYTILTLLCGRDNHSHIWTLLIHTFTTCRVSQGLQGIWDPALARVYNSICSGSLYDT